MTLSRQLAALIIALLIAVFIGTFVISVNNARDYLQNQLATYAQDAAVSLGLSITPYVEENDLATVESMSLAIFDSGFYQQVRVEKMDGSSITDSQLDVVVEDVPRWFISWLPLAPPSGESIVMSGWVQAARVVIKSNTGLAYQQLWRNVTEIALLFVVAAVGFIVIGLFGMKWIMRPLKQVEWQAESISNREFPIVEELPRTLDLRRIVVAMNKMTKKVQSMLDGLEEMAAGLREKAYQNPVTGLPNKPMFMAQLKAMVESTEEFPFGVLALIQLKGFKEYNDKHGYVAGDELLKEAAQVLSPIAGGYSQTLFAHLGGADFALVVPNISEQEAETVGESLSSAMASVYASGKIDTPDVSHIGLAFFDGSQTMSELMGDADSARVSAQSSGANQWKLKLPEKSNERAGLGAQDWNALINKALSENHLVLHYQPVISAKDDSILHYEVLVRMAPAADASDMPLISAGEFLPHAESSGLASEIDKRVIKLVIERLQAEEGQQTAYAINLSLSVLGDESFIGWLAELFTSQPGVADRLVFEMSEYATVARLNHVQHLISVLEQYGSHFSIDHFGRGLGSFAYLRSCRANYLKIDSSYILSLIDDQDHQFFVQSLSEIAHGLDIQVIGEAVESAEVWQLLKDLNLDGGQGYYLGRPS